MQCNACAGCRCCSRVASESPAASTHSDRLGEELAEGNANHVMDLQPLSSDDLSHGSATGRTAH